MYTHMNTYTHTHTPDPAALPKRQKPVYGMALLWQPEVVYPYLALIEHYGSCADTLEAAAGTIQNLTACSWKASTYFGLGSSLQHITQVPLSFMSCSSDRYTIETRLLFG